MSATLYDASGNTLTGIGITWSSSHTAVASVSNDGVVVARSAGTTQITAAAGGLRTSITVTVVRTPSRIVVTPVSARLTEQGETLKFVAVVLDADGAEITDAPLSWRSEHPMVASVDDQGVVTAHMEGETRITVSSGDLSASVTVTVAIETPTNRIVVSPESVNLKSIGETAQLSARVLDPRDQEIPNPDLTWASEDEAVATVDAQGVVTAQMNGQTRVTATWEELSASAMVTVSQAADRILITPGVVRLTSIGEMVELTASVRDANDVEITGAQPTWASEDPAVASVNDQGVVTAQMSGTTRVTATFGMVASSVSVSVSETNADRELLIDFYHATDGPNWTDHTN
ncbi:MAG: Ig-like domain-containing protein [Gemmatimonadota bacterium]|nr:Ig-like domain-containing protein [Gemmatimonadota bacterium]